MSNELQKETSDFVVSFVHSPRRNAKVLTVRSRAAGHHFAEHARFNLLDDDGSLLENPPIDERVARFILENFELRGDTESFNIFRSDLETGRLLDRATSTIEPAQIRHKLTKSENSFTSTGAKLASHWPIFQKFKETGYGSIIRATMTNHQLCTSRCHYCSTIARNRRDSVTLDEAKEFVTKLYEHQAEYNRTNFPEHNERYKALTGFDIRLRGLILSGGGQPNLWPHFAEFVEWLSERDIDLGLITNGFPKNVPESVYEHFKWIRISITPEDASPHYIDGQFNKQYLPATIRHNPRVTVGYSYVVGAWTDDDVLKRVEVSMKENGFNYCRMLTDCNLTRSAQLLAHRNLSDRLRRLGYIDEAGNPRAGFFHQLKYHGTPEQAQELWDAGQCMLQVYNVFWDTTGHEINGTSYSYACDSITVLSEESHKSLKLVPSQRRFDQEKWGTVKNTEVEKLYTEPVRPFFDPRESCSACLFMRNNETVKALVQRETYDDISVDPQLEHSNFP